MEHVAPVLDRHGFVLAVEQPHGRRDGDRLGREPRRDSAATSSATHDRQVHRRLLHDLQARQVPHAHRARRRAGHGRDLRLAPRHGAGADGQDRQLVAGRVRVGGDAAQSRPRGRDADAADGALRHAASRRRARAVAATARRRRSRTRARARQGRRRHVASSSSTTASTAPGAAWAWRSTASASPSSTATARRASTSSATPTPTPTARRTQGWLDEARSSGRTDDRQARAVPDRRRRRAPKQHGERAGSERRAGPQRRRARRSSRCSRPAEVAADAARSPMRFAFARQRQRRQRPRRRGRRHPRPDRLRLRRARHGGAARAARPRARRRSTAILVTHEHSDHVGGVPAFAARHGIPVWLTFGTLDGGRASASTAWTSVYGFDSHDAFAIGDLEIAPVPGAARRARAGAVRASATARAGSAC